MYVEYTELSSFYEKLCTLNIQNWVHSLKNCASKMYKIVYILYKKRVC